jgi:hypothetical protein
VDEQLVFIPSGFNFKLNGLYWISKDKIFLQCIADSPQIEANTAPTPKEVPTEAGEEGKTAPTATTPQAPSGEQPTTPSEAVPSEQPSTSEPVPVPAQPVPVTEPGNEAQPRPAGAGGVMDTRPESEQEKPPTPPAEQNKTQGRARGNRGVAMPLEPGEPATAASN